LTIELELDGQTVLLLNGGPAFQFNEAVSLQILCRTQAEIDRYWSRLSAGGDPEAQQCGWLKDRFGVSWQIVPARLLEMIADPDAARVARVMKAYMPMKKFDLAALEAAYAG
jgi:predicted 3-demethylubiquinone-9 3-methyltransferase (glyoxalase superfamily)